MSSTATIFASNGIGVYGLTSSATDTKRRHGRTNLDLLKSALEEGVRTSEKTGLLFGYDVRVGPFSLFLLLSLLGAKAVEHDLGGKRLE
jgi:hypothetical protein